MDEETAFLQGILTDPEDAMLQRVFTDWLKEQGRWPGVVEAERVGCGHDYPQHHRLCDIRLGGEPFRVTRCIVCGGRLQVFRITDQAWSAQPGVPLWLQGEALQRWIEDDLAAAAAEEPYDRPVDWERYRT